MKTIDLNTWKRKEHFLFFSSFDEPFFGIVSEIDCTIALDKSKDQNISFFSYYLHKVILAINEIEAFRYRIDGDEIVIYDEIHASATIGREDETFAFSFVPFSKDLSQFTNSLKAEIEEVKASKGIRFNDNAIRKDVIHFSAIPWVNFTGLSHARNFKVADSAPKISVGKLKNVDGKWMMPISVNAHHGFVDGYHVGKFLDHLQKIMND